ncbi:ROK family protein [Promineifilum sp.]|uniref:ROK family protein n=1 Tax=Promineifilum sp. TaxID=2664178 RepID=UPI0035B4A57F
MSEPILALDFGGTKLSAALFVANQKSHAKSAKDAKISSLRSWRPLRSLREPLSSYSILDRRRVFTPPDADAAYELAAMLVMAHELLAGRPPAAIGVSFGGPVDYATGVVRLSHHVRGWEAMPLRERLAVEFGCPVAVDNDANVAALGEHRLGAGRGVNDMLYVTVSTGVGGGWILGGRPWRGHEGMAGEIGHTVADPAGPLCLCGKRGCVERLASGPYMAADYAQGSRGAGEQGREASLPQEEMAIPRPLGGVRGGTTGEETTIPLPSGGVRGGAATGEGTEDPLPNPLPRGEGITGRGVAERAATGDLLAREILLRGAWALGVGLGNAANLVNPQRFILGGGVTKSGEAWWAEVRRAAAETALPEVRFDIVPAELGDDAPLWGALALAEGIFVD